MIVYFTDRRMNVLGKASTSLPQGSVLMDDTTTDEIGAAKTLEFTVTYGKERALVENMTLPGNYLLKNSDDEKGFYTIIDSDIDTNSGAVSVYAEDGGLDLLNETATAYENTKSHPIAYYINKFAFDSGWVIGINEISDRSRALSWDGESSVTERLMSVATQFDAEIEFSFEIERMKVVKKLINIYKRRGADNGVELHLGREIKRIITKRSISELATALKVTGGTPDGADAPITLSGYKYDDGDIYLEGTYLKSRSAVKKWSRYNSEEGDYTGHIMKTYTYDTTSKAELCNRAVKELRRISKIDITHEVEFISIPPGIRCGDIVKIIDAEADIRFAARVTKLTISDSNRIRSAELNEEEAT